MAVLLSPIAGVAGQLFDNNGNPLTGGKISTYIAGTTTPQSTFTTSSGGTAHTNPIILDAAGRVPAGGEMWLLAIGLYKFVITTAADALIGTFDNISGISVDAGATSGFGFQNPIVLATNQSVLDGYNAMSAGPITVNPGITVTVPAGSTYTIV